MYEILKNSNFALYAAKYYDNPSCLDVKEFEDDVNRVKYLKRLFNKYRETGELKERLIINHLVIFYNMFGVVPATRMLFQKLKGYEDCLKPFLVLLGKMPEAITNIDKPGVYMRSDEIIMDEGIIRVLRTI